MGLLDALNYPFDAPLILRKQAQLLRALSERPSEIQLRVALLGGATTDLLRRLLHLYLLRDGIEPIFYESEYNRYYEDAVVAREALGAFAPQVVVIHTSARNITAFPAITDTAEQVHRLVSAEVARFAAIWDRLETDYACIVVQNNFDCALMPGPSHLDASAPGGAQNYIAQLNTALVAAAGRHKNVLIHDIHLLSAVLGASRWYDAEHWYSFKLATGLEGSVASAHSTARLIGAALGKTRKCLVLDLDNTLWGGVIGDDGLAGIKLGKDSAQGEAFCAFQRYCLDLKRRGVLLAVASKNELANAQEGFSHPDSVLALADFSAFIANWEPKDSNLTRIARELNIGLDSLVFVDDNPAERALIREQLREVAVPEVGNNVADFAFVLERESYFQRVSVSQEDVQRASYYSDNRVREAASATFASHDEYLSSLQMQAEIAPFRELYLERVVQLANKTNQFNLTTRRYTSAAIREIAEDSNFITLYARLSDRFGDNGLVSVLIAEHKNGELHIDLWLMSCRVLKRELEYALFDSLVAAAQRRGVRRLVGYYLRTPKNGMVAEHFADLGFCLSERAADSSRSVWTFDIPASYATKNKAIKEVSNG